LLIGVPSLNHLKHPLVKSLQFLQHLVGAGELDPRLAKVTVFVRPHQYALHVPSDLYVGAENIPAPSYSVVT
jgi:hypothetical protein